MTTSPARNEIETLNRHTEAAGYTPDSPLWFAARHALTTALEADPDDLTAAYNAARSAAAARQGDLDLLTPEASFEPGWSAVTWCKRSGFELMECHGEAVPASNGLHIGVDRAGWERFFQFPAAELDEVIDSLTVLRRARDLVASRGFETADLRK